MKLYLMFEAHEKCIKENKCFLIDHPVDFHAEIRFIEYFNFYILSGELCAQLELKKVTIIYKYMNVFCLKPFFIWQSKNYK